MTSRILSVSYDPTLLHTRELILQKAGYDVVSVVGFTQAIASCVEPFNLIVIGHSIPEGDKRAIIAELRKQGCQAPVLSLLKAGEHPIPEAAQATTPDPESVLKAVRFLLSPVEKSMDAAE